MKSHSWRAAFSLLVGAMIAPGWWHGWESEGAVVPAVLLVPAYFAMREWKEFFVWGVVPILIAAIAVFLLLSGMTRLKRRGRKFV